MTAGKVKCSEVFRLYSEVGMLFQRLGSDSCIAAISLQLKRDDASASMILVCSLLVETGIGSLYFWCTSKQSTAYVIELTCCDIASESCEP